RLDIGGSFLGSTAESILFKDGFNYSAIVSDQPQLLTVSVPLGLQMGINPGSITVEGNGHALSGGVFFPSAFNNTDTGLQVNQGQTLGLIGAEINLNGGIVRVPGGNIQLSSIEQGIFKFEFDNNSQSWQFDSSQVESFANINLSNKSLLDTSGFITGNIQLQGKNISLKNGSVALIQNLGNQVSGKIIANATESIQLQDSIRNAPDTITPFGTITGVINSSLLTQNLGTKKGGDIFISGKNLSISDGSLILSATYSNGDTGNIDVNIDQLIEIKESSLLNPTIVSLIGTSNFSAGNSGNINVSAQNITLLDGGLIAISNIGSGQGGDIQVNVDQDLTIIGSNPLFAHSGIFNSSYRTGDSGKLTVNTSRLSIFNGGEISGGTVAPGNAGQVIVNAYEYILVKGSIPETGYPSTIGSEAPILDLITRQVFGLPDRPSGDSGNVIINTPSLTVADGARVGVSNEGLGNSGDLQINAGQIFLDTASIAAFSASGEGGNINLNIQDSLLLRDSSAITSEAKSVSNGGNITINSPVIAGFENSDVIANAVEGNGGNIDITTQGLFGLEFREQLTEESDITASSEFGINGTVEINNVNIDPSSGLVELPSEITDSSQQIAQGCSSGSDNSFVVTGKGGIPQNPQQYINSNQYWSDIRDLSVSRKSNNNNTENTRISNKPAIVEATGFIRNQNGEIELVASVNKPLNIKQISNCSEMNT
ncbi:MAG: S-layer family protein, partial [Cyanobacteria bacterium P01_D01_bin.116]